MRILLAAVLTCFIGAAFGAAGDDPNQIPVVLGLGAIPSSGSMAFSSITAGTNTGQALVIGNGSSLTASGTGVIIATSVASVPWNTLTAPTGNLSIAHAAFTTGFTWNSATTGTPWTQSSSSLSSGTLVSLLVSGTAAASNTQTVFNVGTSGANATATQTTYGAQFANTHTGATSTNVAALFNASGATNNYAAIFNAGLVGIGTVTPAAKVNIAGITSGRTTAYAGFPLSGIALRLNPVATAVTVADLTTAVVIDPTYDDTVGSSAHAALAFPNGGSFISFGQDLTAAANPGVGQVSQYMCYWYSKLGAFRAGRDGGTRFSDDANIGLKSAAFNLGGAEGENAFGINELTDAQGRSSFAQGLSTLASGITAAAFNTNSVASGNQSTAFGSGTSSGLRSFSAAAGSAGGTDSISLGASNNASSVSCIAIGNLNACTQQRACAFGENNTVNNFVGMAFGYFNTSSGVVSVAIGDSTAATADRAFTIGSGVDTANKMTNGVTQSLGIGFLSTVPTLFISPGTGAGTYGRVGIAVNTSTPLASLEVAAAGAASLPGAMVSGAWFSGGSATTTKPQFLVLGSGAATNAWSTSGTGIGVGAAAGFVGRLLDLQLNGVTVFNVTSSGLTTVADTTEASAVGTASVTTAGGLGIAKRSFLGTIGTSFKGNVDAGVQDGTAAVSGQVGEIIESKISTATNAAATATYLELTHLDLTPGDWVLCATAISDPNGATFTLGTAGVLELNIATATAATTGTTLGYDRVLDGQPTLSGNYLTMNVAGKRINITVNTTYYCNVYATYTAGTPRWYGSITATRVR